MKDFDEKFNLGDNTNEDPEEINPNDLNLHESSFDNLQCGSEGNEVERAGDLFSSNEEDNNDDNMSNKA